MKTLLLLLLSFVTPAMIAQSTTVSSTGVVDPSSITWANGTYRITFMPDAHHSPGQYTWSGGALTQTFTGALSATGTFSLSLPSNTSITPAGSLWSIQACPNASGSCYGVALLITGSTQDITTALNAVIKAPLFAPSPLVWGYADSELLSPPGPGAIYYNVTDNKFHCWTGTSWSTTCGGNTGSTPLFTKSVTAVAEIDIVTRNVVGTSGAIFQSDYENYQCIVSSFHNAVDPGGVPVIQFSANGGVTWDTGNNYGWAQQWWKTTATTGDVRLGTISNGIPIMGDPTGVGPSVTGVPSSATFTIYSPNLAVTSAVRGNGFIQTSDQFLFEMGGYEGNTIARNAMRIVPSLGASFTFSGTFRCYGLTN